MADGYIENVEKVEEYLKELKRILCSVEFDLETDLDVLFGSSKGSTGCKNIQTMEALGYDKSDIHNELLSLMVNDYSETLPDVNNPNSPQFYVFGKMINTKEIYIKVKIRNNTKHQVFCISFHFAQYPILKPYSV